MSDKIAFFVGMVGWEYGNLTLEDSPETPEMRPTMYLRGGLLRGLEQGRKLGVNPFRFGESRPGALMQAGLLHDAETYYLSIRWLPLASIFGGLAFGYGMALTGNCAHGALARRKPGYCLPVLPTAAGLEPFGKCDAADDVQPA